MGRPSKREERRSQILQAFASVLADHGYAGATVSAVAEAADVRPGLVHHYFRDKQEMLEALLSRLLSGFRQRVAHYEREEDPLMAYADGALALDDRSDVVAARCWVGLFAEAIRNPTLFKRVRRMIDLELETIRARSGHRLSNQEAGAVLAFIIGSLVVGAFAPKKTAGFAAPGLRSLLKTFGVDG